MHQLQRMPILIMKRLSQTLLINISYAILLNPPIITEAINIFIKENDIVFKPRDPIFFLRLINKSKCTE